MTVPGIHCARWSGRRTRRRSGESPSPFSASARPRLAVRAVRGVPAEALLTAAADAGMIVVGSRGAGGFAKLRMGSVSSYLTHHAHCPVVVVPDDGI